MADQTIEDNAGDEKELDTLIESDLAKFRTETPPAAPAPAKTEEPAKPKEDPAAPAEKPVEPPSPAPAAAPEPVVPDPAKPGEDFKKPIKGPTESQETYNKRVELAALIDARKKAKTPEEKERLTKEITTTRTEMKVINPKEDITKPGAPVLQKSEEDIKKETATKAAQDNLRAIGGATKEDIEKIISDRDFQNNVAGTLKAFVDRHPQFKDEDVREVFFDFVDSNYNWQSKSGDALMTVLELAREAMDRPSETISERVLKGADVQNKVNAMQFPGGTVVKPALSPEKQKSLEELKSTGMSEERAMAFISDDE